MGCLRDAADRELIQYNCIYEPLLRFEERKRNFVNFGSNPKALAGTYAHEGALYHERKARGAYRGPNVDRLPPSASAMHSKGTNFFPRRNGQQVQFKDLSLEQFREVDRRMRGPGQRTQNVIYLSKAQRLRYMVDVQLDGSLIWMRDGSDVNCTCQTVDYDLDSGDPYIFAMDVYANLFVSSPSDMGDNASRGRYVNHSSLCAGNDVLCSGTISIRNGILRGITNFSGHYQPSADQLKNSMTILRNAGVSMNGVLVRVYVDQGGQSVEEQWDGALFLAGGNGPKFPQRKDFQQYADRTV